MFVAYLISNRHVNPHMSSYQIFRIALLNLSEANWHTNGISVKDSLKLESIDPKHIPISEFHKHYQVVFLDSTGYMNITSKMSLQTFLRVKREARLGMSLLNNELSGDNFNQLFINNQSPQIVFDALMRSVKHLFSNDNINNINYFKKLFSVNPYSNSQFYFDILKKVPSEQIKLIENYNNSYAISVKVILDLVNKALRERTELVFAHFVPTQRVFILLY
jgi:hypothetical protein